MKKSVEKHFKEREKRFDNKLIQAAKKKEKKGQKTKHGNHSKESDKDS